MSTATLTTATLTTATLTTATLTTAERIGSSIWAPADRVRMIRACLIEHNVERIHDDYPAADIHSTDDMTAFAVWLLAEDLRHAEDMDGSGFTANEEEVEASPGDHSAQLHGAISHTKESFEAWLAESGSTTMNTQAPIGSTPFWNEVQSRIYG